MYLQDQSYLFFYTLNGSLKKLKELLKLLPNDRKYIARCIYEKDSSPMKEFVQENNFEIHYENNCYLFHLSREVGLMLNNVPPDDVIIKSLTYMDAKLINSVYPLRDETTADLFDRLIKYNPNLGVFDKDTGQLLAWCVQFQSGELSALQVKSADQKRQGLATLVLIEMIRTVAENGFEPFGIISTRNKPPLMMADKYSEMGVTRVSDIYHVVFGPNKKSKL